MKIVLLRGGVPTDRSPKEITYNSLEESDCIYEHMAAGLGDERCEILYFGGSREVSYSDTCTVKWVKKLSKYEPDFYPDVIWCRGGFKEYEGFIKKFPKAKRIYYGAGKRKFPEYSKAYDVVLADSMKDKAEIEERGYHSELWFKPALPMFKKLDIKKKYDVCFVAIHPGDKRKNIKWVYETAPKKLQFLQLGNTPKFKVPKNFKIKKALRSKVPKLMNQCHVGVMLYGKDDANPRVLAEMLCCGLPVIALKSTRFWVAKYFSPIFSFLGDIVGKEIFWSIVVKFIKQKCPSAVSEASGETLSVENAVRRLKTIIEEGG